MMERLILFHKLIEIQNVKLVLICLFRISIGTCGRFTQAELLALFCSLFLVMVWMITGHWILMDGLL
jgi:hypothetical protein